MPTSPAAALADLFSKARLTLQLPSSSPAASRSVAFFDEVLNVQAILTLPSDPLLPIASASTSAHASPHPIPLPLPALPSSTSLAQQSISPYLTALLACLHVNLVSDYVPNQPSPSTHTSKSTNPYEPLATVQSRFEHLQLLPSHNPHPDPAQPQHAAVRAFSNAWAGNQPPKPHRTLKDSSNTQGSMSSSFSHKAHLTHDGQHWSVHWHCRVPVNYIATPFLPSLSITAALTLRLDQALLQHLIPVSSTPPFARSGFAHSLLSPLHEGPVYPDESPLQSQARANAASALGLDGPNGLGSFLAHLPKDVVGGNNAVVTPRSGARALGAIHERRNDALAADPALNRPISKPDVNGDLAALTSRPTSIPHFAQSSAQAESGQSSPGLQIYKRSTRKLLPLKTGLNVRMRTLATKHDPHVHRRASPHPALSQLDTTRLVLSVELENPFESDAAFTVNDIQIKIASSQTDPHDSYNIVAKPLQPMASILPIQLSRASQHNLLFYVSVEAGHAQCSSKAALDQRLAGPRNVTITVSGQPQGDKEQMADFDSQWNCALDLTPILSDAAKRNLIGSQPSTSRLSQQPLAGPVAGNSQYSASALRTATHDRIRSSYTSVAPPRTDHAEDARTPRPGQLGMGFPPPLRSSSARQFSTATAATAVQHPAIESQSTLQEPTTFLQKARSRAAARNATAQMHTSDHLSGVSVKPWMSQSVASRELSEGGLVVLSDIRHAGVTATGRADPLEGHLNFESTLGDDGLARPSVSTGAKTLHPTSVATSAFDDRAARFQTGDTVLIDLTILHRSSPSGIAHTADTITDIALSWANPTDKMAPSKALNRDSVDAATDVSRARLIDADSARHKSSSLLSQAESLNGLVPIQGNLALQEPLLVGQSTSVALALRCLSPGFHAIPSLQMQFQCASGEQGKVLLEGLGRVHVSPAAVL
ncbi:hypothetical protein PHSY_000962 [Pseudozyma hubeiensis SY62]|uniref:Uncharacterized protein n=1 Tax=Pseudozyma hubeiensis (strain SY62) TaxID=1305764 RepID=R9NXW1_PSEHS|nr:hypothetical protein PHSY_000962 [Pseudozyma hubeiensis SY62]GAC93397.1 hypothetical protein PHSY_000962 [Pseudozyma hubeiensis SY62]